MSSKDNEIIVYTAAKVYTMTPELPCETAIAIQSGRIVEVGSLDTMQPWLDALPHRIDTRFSDKVFFPGFIDPHLHPTMAAFLLQTHFITAKDWKLPHGNSLAVDGQDNYRSRLQEIHESIENPTEPLLTWGYHSIWHGELSRQILDGIVRDRPVVVWQRSTHEMFLNSAAIEWLKIDEVEASRHHQVNMKEGRFWEMGGLLVQKNLDPYLLEPGRIKMGLQLLKEVLTLGGHTTIGEMGWGMFDRDLEWNALTDVLDNDETPFRVVIVPHASLSGNACDEMKYLLSLGKMTTERLWVANHVKLFADGSLFGETMQLMEPGYIDGHDGEWMTSPEQLELLCREAWLQGLAIHVHSCGDLGVELVLDILEKLQRAKPKFDHRFTLEHFGIATPEQCKRIATLGAQVSVNPYYLHELGNVYWKHVIGKERATQMARLGSLARNEVTFALHSDFPMAPAHPLLNVWVAVNRICDGEILGPEQKISVEQAMQAITINAAYMLGIENEVGSLRAGKRADITVLDQDPYEVPPFDLCEIRVEGVIFEGVPRC